MTSVRNEAPPRIRPRRGCSSSTTSRTSSSCCRRACASPASRSPPRTTGTQALDAARELPPRPDRARRDDAGHRRLRGRAPAARPRAAACPVLFLTARDAAEDKITGLTVGGDDYVTKPFSLEEVIARIRAVLRRSAGGAERAGRPRLTLRRHRARRRHPRGLEGRRAGRAVADRVQAAALLHAERRPGAVQGADPRPRLELRLRRRRQRRRVLRLLPAPQDRHRPSRACCTRCAASATCCACPRLMRVPIAAGGAGARTPLRVQLVAVVLLLVIGRARHRRLRSAPRPCAATWSAGSTPSSSRPSTRSSSTRSATPGRRSGRRPGGPAAAGGSVATAAVTACRASSSPRSPTRPAPILHTTSALRRHVQALPDLPHVGPRSTGRRSYTVDAATGDGQWRVLALPYQPSTARPARC